MTFSGLRRARIIRSLAMGLVLACGGCATKVANIDNNNVGTLVDQFVDGKAQLDCALACAGSFGANRQAMLAMYKAGDWSRLAKTVMTVGFDQDLSWFYLGRSAEGLGLGDTAVEYYTRALESQYHCDANTCDGFLFPDDVLTQASGLGAQL
jgi:hypothetical protein